MDDMPRLKRRKDGYYYIHAPGDRNPVNTFQVTDNGVGIIKSSNTDLDDYFSSKLLFISHDLGHLSTKNDTYSDKSDLLGEISVKKSPRELSDGACVYVAVEIAGTHGVDQLFQDGVAGWLLPLVDLSPDTTKPLTVLVLDAAGFSYESVAEYRELGSDFNELTIALGLYLQSVWQKESAEFKEEPPYHPEREILGTEDGYTYLKVPDSDEFEYGIPEDMPEFIDPDQKKTSCIHSGERVLEQRDLRPCIVLKSRDDSVLRQVLCCQKPGLKNFQLTFLLGRN